MLCGGRLPPPPVLLAHAMADLEHTATTGHNPRCFGLVDRAVLLSPAEQAELLPSHEAALNLGDDLLLAVMHVGTIWMLCEAPVMTDVTAGPLRETPLMIAARFGNAAVTGALMVEVADPELMRWVATQRTATGHNAQAPGHRAHGTTTMPHTSLILRPHPPLISLMVQGMWQRTGHSARGTGPSHKPVKLTAPV